MIEQGYEHWNCWAQLLGYTSHFTGISWDINNMGYNADYSTLAIVMRGIMQQSDQNIISSYSLWYCAHIIVRTLQLNLSGWKLPWVDVCRGLVINSEMTWWLSSPFLVLLRWHILPPGSDHILWWKQAWVYGWCIIYNIGCKAGIVRLL